MITKAGSGYKENDVKKYVSVEARFDPDGKIVPQRILWGFGETYEIDKVLDVTPAASLKAGGAGIRYTIRIRGKDTYLFYENDSRWFVESKRPS